MDTSKQITVGTGSHVMRRRRSVEEKRRMVEETLEAGASVARIALRHRINVNQVFSWRKKYREGRLGKSSKSFLQQSQTSPIVTPDEWVTRLRPLLYRGDAGRRFHWLGHDLRDSLFPGQFVRPAVRVHFEITSKTVLNFSDKTWTWGSLIIVALPPGIEWSSNPPPASCFHPHWRPYAKCLACESRAQKYVIRPG
jgi:transposase-like protein